MRIYKYNKIYKWSKLDFMHKVADKSNNFQYQKQNY